MHCSLRCVGLLLPIVMSSVVAARADTVSYTSFISGDLNCNSEFPCEIFSLSVPQFDPTLGTLSGVSWTFADFQQYVIYLGESSVTSGEMYTFSYTEGDVSAILGLDASTMEEEYWTTCGCDRSLQDFDAINDEVGASGTVPDDSPFVGTGSVAIQVQPFFDASFPLIAPPNGGSVYPGIGGVSDSMTLTVTYDYAATPEPSGGVIVLGVAFLIALGLKAHRTIKVQ
jgi:hypothetical protein